MTAKKEPAVGKNAPKIKKLERTVHEDAIVQIKEIMKEKKINQSELSRIADKLRGTKNGKDYPASLPFVQRAMHGYNNVTVNTLATIALALDCDLKISFIPKNPE